jgi:hypothetical protein
LLSRTQALKLVIEFAPQILRMGGTDPAEFLRSLESMGLTVSPVEAGVPSMDLDPRLMGPMMAEIEKRGAINLLCEKSGRPTLSMSSQ